MSIRWLVACLLWLIVASAFAQQASPRQKELLEQLRRLLPASKPWDDWVAGSKAYPPNFDDLPSIPFLPDPLRFQNGREVKFEDWGRRRQELLALCQYYIVGTIPPTPTNVQAGSIRSREEAGALIDDIVLTFGPKNAARLHVELIIPKGKPPFPVFITQDNHRQWALVAVSRGYIGCVYAGADSRDDTGDWPAIWPEANWTKLTRRAWAASRCIDYLHTLPVVETNQIALTGHSRNGKTSLIAAALDLRVNAVISSSSGAGGACSYRFFSEHEFGEGIELITRTFPDWLHPRLRFFAGRENKLPVDQNGLMACIAPRPCLISTALNDPVESVWAIEQTYYSARRAYKLLGKPDELNLRYRNGNHETRAEDIEAYLDWLDAVFGRKPFSFPDVAIYPTYEQWQKLQGEEKQIDPTRFANRDLHDLLLAPGGKVIKTDVDWEAKTLEVRERILWTIGQAPSFGESRIGKYGAEAAHAASMLGRSTVPAGIEKQSLNFGNYLAGDLYFPSNSARAGGKIPGVVWVHPLSVSSGYVPGYKRGENPHIAMARRGFAVLAFDQIGNGGRLQEIRNFYFRYPEWSLLGKMMDDTLAGVEALGKIDFVDPAKIYVLGYGQGATVALHAAALNDSIAGVIAVGGVSSMRLDTAGTGGLARYSIWHPLLPKLGAFVGQEKRAPYDYHELLALVAPRPAIIIAPQLDYHANPNDVRMCVNEATKIYGLYSATNNLRLIEVEDYSRFSPETQKVAYDQMERLARGIAQPMSE